MPPGGKQKQAAAASETHEAEQQQTPSKGSQTAAGALAVRRIAGRPDVEASPDFAYARSNGQAFVKGKGDKHAVSPDDVLQGQVGDCWFLASVIATAAVNPQMIEDLIKPLGNGKYEVTIYTRDEKTKKKTKNIVTIDDTFPVYKKTISGHSFQFNEELTFQKGDGVFAHGGDGTIRTPEIWPRLIEKAAAMVRIPGHASYEGLGAGPGAEGLDMLVPDEKWPETLSLTKKSKDGYYVRNPEFEPTVELAEKMYIALASGQPIVCGAAKCYSGDHTFIDSHMIMGMHVYAVVKVDIFAKTLDLQDPNGRTNCTVSIDEWKKTFGYCNIGRSTHGDK